MCDLVVKESTGLERNYDMYENEHHMGARVDVLRVVELRGERKIISDWVDQ